MLDRASATACEHLPHAAPRCHGIAAAAIEKSIEPVGATGIRRDFYFDQVLNRGQPVRLLDLDPHGRPGSTSP